MKRLLLLLNIILLASVQMHAGNREGAPLLRYGLEWGTTGTLYTSVHQNYTAEEGYRIDEYISEWTYISNAFVSANFGFNILPGFAAGLYAGYAGLTSDRRMFPLTLRLTCTPKGYDNDSFTSYIEGGFGFTDIKHLAARCTLASGGVGYHMALSRSVSIDYLASLRFAMDHPAIIDQDSGITVPTSSIRLNNVIYLSLNFGIAVNF